MAYLIDEVATYLEAQGVGTIGTTIFKTYKADAADDVLFVLDTGGVAPDHYLPTADPTFQIFIQASDYASGKQKLQTVRGLLHNFRPVGMQLITGGTTYLFIQALAEGGHIGKNERGLEEFSINFHARSK